RRVAKLLVWKTFLFRLPVCSRGVGHLVSWNGFSPPPPAVVAAGPDRPSTGIYVMEPLSFSPLETETVPLTGKCEREFALPHPTKKSPMPETIKQTANRL